MTAIRRIHLVYASGSSISAPATIGRHLAELLSRDYDVEVHDWQGTGRIRPAADAALVGHPHPVALTTFRRSLGPGWGRTVTMMPFHTGEIGQVAFADAAICGSDHFLAITGGYWFDALPTSPLRHWAARARHLDLAVDRSELPRVKGAFAPPGERRVLYVGSTARAKSPEYLVDIRRRLPDVEFGWIGPGGPLPGFTAYGSRDFSAPGSLDIVKAHDVMITAGFADANPTTVLEAASWGLHPVCTQTSGYPAEPGLTTIPFGDPDRAAGILRNLLSTPTEQLERDRACLDERLRTHYSWNRFADTVRWAIETPGTATGKRALHTRFTLAYQALTGSSGPLQKPGRSMRKQLLILGLRSARDRCAP